MKLCYEQIVGFNNYTERAIEDNKLDVVSYQQYAGDTLHLHPCFPLPPMISWGFWFGVWHCEDVDENNKV